MDLNTNLTKTPPTNAPTTPMQSPTTSEILSPQPVMVAVASLDPPKAARAAGNTVEVTRRGVTKGVTSSSSSEESSTVSREGVEITAILGSLNKR